jgi:hypothetical protein
MAVNSDTMGPPAPLSPEQQKWLGGADANDPYIRARMLKAVPNPPEQTSLYSFDPKQLRLGNAGLNPGGLSCRKEDYAAKDVPVSVDSQGGVQTDSPSEDWRVKVSLAPSSTIFYKSSNAGIMSRLKDTGGAIFPYTPQISVTHAARYAEQKLTHSNYASYFYEGSDVSSINISGEFTVQTPGEGQYLLAVISFFRSCTKMFFGNQDTNTPSGSPPPMVFLNGYGKYYFPNVPCVLTSFQHTMPPDVDYVEISQSYLRQQEMVKSSVGKTRVPTTSTLAITLQPVYSRRMVHQSFNLDKFANGDLLISGAEGQGGFL